MKIDEINIFLSAPRIYTWCCCMLQIDSGEDAQEEFGWKLVHGDVFRPPRKGMLLSVLLGSGTQVFCMSLITLGKNCVLHQKPQVVMMETLKVPV